MRHSLIVSAFVLLAQGTALADPTVITVPPPLEPAGSCQVEYPKCQAALGERQQALDSCNKMTDDLVVYVKEQCPAFSDMTKDEILDHAKTKAPPPKKVVKVVDNGHKPKSPPPAPKPTLVIKMERFDAHDGCPAGGLLLSTTLGDKVLDTKVVCDGKDGAQGPQGLQGIKGDTGAQGKQGLPGKPGNSGRPGRDGDTRVEFGLGLRTSAIWSKGRPTGYSAAPEASLELWLAPTVEFVSGIAWAPDGDRNMVVTGQVRYRGLNKRIGIGLGIQYQAWNLEGNKALWQSVLGMGSVQAVLIESKHIDVSLEAGLLVGLDGYDAAAQFAIGGTGQVSAALKF